MHTNAEYFYMYVTIIANLQKILWNFFIHQHTDTIGNNFLVLHKSYSLLNYTILCSKNFSVIKYYGCEISRVVKQLVLLEKEWL